MVSGANSAIQQLYCFSTPNGTSRYQKGIGIYTKSRKSVEFCVNVSEFTQNTTLNACFRT